MDYDGEYDWVELHRGELPESALFVRDPRIENYDSQAICVYNPKRPAWSLYRVVFHGASPAGDLLRHEFDLDRLPGPWVVDEMRKRALVRSGETSMDPVKAGKQFVTSVKDLIGRRKREKDKQWNQFVKGWCLDWRTYVERGKTSCRHGKPQNLKPALRSGREKVRGVDIAGASG